MFSLNFMFFCSLIEELCTKEENDKTGCNFNFGHECIININVCLSGIRKKYYLPVPFSKTHLAIYIKVHLILTLLNSVCKDENLLSS